jgi:hypothetical protein
MALQRTISLAITFASLSCLGPLLCNGGGAVTLLGLVLTLYASFPLTVAWALSVGYAFFKFGKRGWPAILGAPLVAWPLVTNAQVSYACSHTGCF